MSGYTLLARVVDDVRYTLRSDACGVHREPSGEVRLAVVHCDDLEAGHAHRAAWGVTVRLVDGKRVDAHDAYARQLPPAIEAEVVSILRAARPA